MELLISLAILVFIWWLSHKYFAFALLDSKSPEAEPSQFSILASSLLFTLVYVISIGFKDSQPKMSADFTMVGAGLLLAPAIAPPFFLDKKGRSSYLEHWKAKIHGWISGQAMLKIIAVFLFICCSIFDISWVYITCGVAAFLLVAKGASCMQNDAARSENILLQQLTVRWANRISGAVICFALLWALYPYTLSGMVEVKPSSWSAFAGLGIGAVLLQFVVPK